jgi:serine/threonine-protein kinase RsbW
MAVPDSEPKRVGLRKSMEELPRLVQWIEAWTERNAAPDLALAIALSVEEAVANIVMYSPTQDDELEITVEMERRGRLLTARIEDNGCQFDPTEVAPASLAASIEDAKVGGLGIHLMRSFADEMQYEHRDGRNRLILRFVEPRTARAG